MDIDYGYGFYLLNLEVGFDLDSIQFVSPGFSPEEDLGDVTRKIIPFFREVFAKKAWYGEKDGERLKAIGEEKLRPLRGKKIILPGTLWMAHDGFLQSSYMEYECQRGKWEISSRFVGIFKNKDVLIAPT